MTRRAFTLIELLIVVAIIAILAAIAVPNFLEAQTRSKVSRAKADLRTIATAVESYRVDYNKVSRSIGLDVIERRWVAYTTPIAYITSIPDDVFGDDVELSDWRINPDGSGPEYPRYRVFDYVTFLEREDGSREHSGQYQVLTDRGFSTEIDWYVASQGPDNSVGLQFGSAEAGVIYDPTNGTISRGDVIRVSGSGQLE